MKKLLFLFALVALYIGASAQVTAFTQAGTTDSSATKYCTTSVGGGLGALTIQTNIVKIANTGSTVAGYARLQGSLDGTNYENVKTYKTPVYGSVPQASVYGVDTFTLSNVTTVQTKAWQVTGAEASWHPYFYYRVAVVMTTTKVTPTAYYLFRKQN